MKSGRLVTLNFKFCNDRLLSYRIFKKKNSNCKDRLESSSSINVKLVADSPMDPDRPKDRFALHFIAIDQLNRLGKFD